MNLEKLNVRELENSEMKEIDGGIIGLILAAGSLILAGATAYGYYEGKKDCESSEDK